MDLLTQKQNIQEAEYFLPRHWNIKRNTRKGVVFFGYWEMALEIAGDTMEKEVLDIGCGDGYFTSLIAKKGAKTIKGIDYSERAISFARMLEPRVHFTVGDTYDLPFEDKKFDVVFLIETLEHIPIPRRQKAIEEIARVLKTKGTLVVSVPSIHMPLIDKHEEHFSLESLQGILRDAFILQKARGQDRGGIRFTIFWLLFRIWKNRFFTIHPLVNLWTLWLYSMALNQSSLNQARRIVGLFEKQ